MGDGTCNGRTRARPRLRHDAVRAIFSRTRFSRAFRRYVKKIDRDGNGAIDKKELRRAVAALGYDASKKDVDALFESIDDDSNGMIEYEELKAALDAAIARTK